MQYSNKGWTSFAGTCNVEGVESIEEVKKRLKANLKVKNEGTNFRLYVASNGTAVAYVTAAENDVICSLGSRFLNLVETENYLNSNWIPSLTWALKENKDLIRASKVEIFMDSCSEMGNLTAKILREGSNPESHCYVTNLENVEHSFSIGQKSSSCDVSPALFLCENKSSKARPNLLMTSQMYNMLIIVVTDVVRALQCKLGKRPIDDMDEGISRKKMKWEDGSDVTDDEEEDDWFMTPFHEDPLKWGANWEEEADIVSRNVSGIKREPLDDVTRGKFYDMQKHCVDVTRYDNLKKFFDDLTPHSSSWVEDLVIHGFEVHDFSLICFSGANDPTLLPLVLKKTKMLFHLKVSGSRSHDEIFVNLL